MAKELFKGSVLMGPLPAVLVTTVDVSGKVNVFYRWLDRNCLYTSSYGYHCRSKRTSLLRKYTSNG